MRSSVLGSIVVLLLYSFVLTSSATVANGGDFSNGTDTVRGTTGGSRSFDRGIPARGPLPTGVESNGGGTFIFNSKHAFPNGVPFSSTFSGPVTWTQTALAGGTLGYTLAGVVTGTVGGASVNSVKLQLRIKTGKQYFHGASTISGGNPSTVSSVPEPSTLALFVTGSVPILGIMLRKLFAS